MILKSLYISAPSRSGSSLLIRVLNCTDSIVAINEPVDSVNILNRDNIRTIFSSLECELKKGYVSQRVAIDGSEITDTFPPSNIKWGKVRCSFRDVKVIGIKKSFPAFSNKDYFRPFIQEWLSFVQWMNEVMGGSVIVIVRDPKLTMLSWKTTFDALSGNTEDQCLAWNEIASAILSSKNLGVLVVRYEELVEDPCSVVSAISRHVGVKAVMKNQLPPVNNVHLEGYLEKKGIPIGIAKNYFRIVDNICGEIAKKFGYEKFYS